MASQHLSAVHACVNLYRRLDGWQWSRWWWRARRRVRSSNSAWGLRIGLISDGRGKSVDVTDASRPHVGPCLCCVLFPGARSPCLSWCAARRDEGLCVWSVAPALPPSSKPLAWHRASTGRNEAPSPNRTARLTKRERFAFALCPAATPCSVIIRNGLLPGSDCCRHRSAAVVYT